MGNTYGCLHNGHFRTTEIVDLWAYHFLFIARFSLKLILFLIDKLQGFVIKTLRASLNWNINMIVVHNNFVTCFLWKRQSTVYYHLIPSIFHRYIQSADACIKRYTFIPDVSGVLDFVFHQNIKSSTDNAANNGNSPNSEKPRLRRQSLYCSHILKASKCASSIILWWTGQ